MTRPEPAQPPVPPSLAPPQQRPRPAARVPAHLAWIGLAVAVALAYLFGLGGQHIPRSGDEMVYAHIARLTAETGHWLPLVSSYDFMRNTKPPLLFWQAMVAGGWGEHWTLFNLRLPSLLYTWGTALMVGLLAWKISRDAPADADAGLAAQPQPQPQPQVRRRRAMTTGAIAVLVYLSFFTTYRYGRPFLTNAPETFWLFGVFFALAWSPAARLAEGWKFVLPAGLAVGMACLYKSFVMVVPAGFALALCYQAVGARAPLWRLARPGIVADGLKVAAVCALGVAMFGLWFALDPQPGEVWREFVVQENGGKMNGKRGYFAIALSGSSGLLTILTGYFSNALFLLPIAVGAMGAAWGGWRQRRGTARAIGEAEKIMWLWLLALALVFMLPSQRSTRYLIPAMPALAVLVALYWQRIARAWFGLTLAACLAGLLVMGLIGYGAVRATHDTGIYSPLFWLFVAGAALACLAGLLRPAWTRPVSAPAGFAVLLALAWAQQPFNGEIGRFRPETEALLRGQEVAVPTSFNGYFERYAFLMPGARLAPYFTAQPLDYAEVPALLQASRYAVVQRRIGQAPCAQCRIVDARWDLRASRDDGGVREALRSPETYWYAREYVVERLAP